MKDRDGYMSRDAWSERWPVLHLQYSSTTIPSARPEATKSSLSSDLPSSLSIRRAWDPTIMPIAASQTGTIKSNPEDPSINNLQDSLQALNLNKPSTDQTTPSALLALPAELRTTIYAFALSSNLNLLLTSKQLHMETSPLLYQRPLSFPSQAALKTWLSHSHQTDLNRVRTLTLRLTDIDISPLVQDPRCTAWRLYQRELEMLDKALLCLPNLSDLTVVPPERKNSQLLRGMYFSFLGLIPERLPSLRRLVVRDDAGAREKVPNLRKLACPVVFDGPSSPPPSEERGAGYGFSSFSDVMKNAKGERKVKVEESESGMEGVWYQRR